MTTEAPSDTTEAPPAEEPAAKKEVYRRQHPCSRWRW